MKIFHVIFSMQIGGSETMLVDILNEQVKSSNTVGLIIINDNYKPELLEKISPKVRIIMMGRKKGYNTLWVGLKMNCFMFKENPDIIHFHDDSGINFLLNKKKYKTVFTVHALNLHLPNAHKYTRICAISKTVQEELSERVGVESELIYNGIHIKDICVKERISKERRIIQVGRLAHEIKGQDILLNALALVQEKYPEIPVSLDIIGAGESLSELQDMSSRLGLKRVSFLGSKDRKYIYKQLANYDLLVQPSRYEGFGLVIAEALAANIQVLVSDIGAPMEVIHGDKYGFTFKVGDPEDCARQIERILIDGESKNMNEVDEYLAENFDIRQTAKRYLALYEKIVDK